MRPTASQPHSFAMRQCLGAFSLVELSIVLVILGLLVGGVLSGKSLIRASELRSVTTQHRNFVAAFYSFKDKYFYLPGDIPNATQFWGALDPTPVVCDSMVATDTRTCNGLGDGRIFGDSDEWRAWQHLANAKLIEGSFQGTRIVAADFYHCRDSRACPQGKIANSNWFVSHIGVASNGFAFFGNTGHLFNGDYGHTLFFGNHYYGMTFTWDRVLRPEEAWNIDAKIDDGKPATGKVVAVGGTNLPGATKLAGCTTATGTDAAQAAMLSADYLLSTSNIGCALGFRNQF